MSKTSAFFRRSGRTLVVAALVPLAGVAHAHQHTPALAQERDNVRMRDGDIVVTGTKTGELGPVRIEAPLTNFLDWTYDLSDNLSRYSLGTEDRVLPGERRTLSVRIAYRFGGAR